MKPDGYGPIYVPNISPKFYKSGSMYVAAHQLLLEQKCQKGPKMSQKQTNSWAAFFL